MRLTTRTSVILVAAGACAVAGGALLAMTMVLVPLGILLIVLGPIAFIGGLIGLATAKTVQARRDRSAESGKPSDLEGGMARR